MRLLKMDSPERQLVVDAAGVTWPAMSDVSARRSADLRRRCDIAAATLAEGSIYVRFHSSGVRIVLRPEMVTRKAIARLAVLIGGTVFRRIALCVDRTLSSWQLLGDAGRAIALIDALVSAAQQPWPRALIHAKDLALEDCQVVASGRLFPLLQAWVQRGGIWDPGLTAHLEGAKLWDHTVLCSRPPHSEDIVFCHWGARINVYGRNWPRIARGRNLFDQPDREIARWHVANVGRVLAAGLPRLNEVDMVHRRIDGNLVRSGYLRLALPWRSPDGTTLLTAMQSARKTVVLERP